MFYKNVRNFSIFALFFFFSRKLKSKGIDEHVHVIKFYNVILKCFVLLYNLAINCPFVHVLSTLGLISGEVLVLYL